VRPDPGPPVNERVLRFRDIRVIDANGEQLGILQSRKALDMAKEQGLDLVMVSPNANPPVCKIIDHGKFKYLTEKQQRDNKRKQQDVKGIKISPRIAEHDMTFLIKNASKFLEEGHKVKVTCMFKAREVTHPELGRKKLDYFAEQTAHLATVERSPTLDGRLMIMVLVPKPQTGTKKNAKTEDQQDSRQEVQDNGNGQDNPEAVAQQPHVLAQEGQPEASS
jgi:translation initiation factor IF-3